MTLAFAFSWLARKAREARQPETETKTAPIREPEVEQRLTETIEGISQAWTPLPPPPLQSPLT